MSLEPLSVPPPATTARGLASRRRLIDAARAELVERHGHLEIDSVARRADTSVGLIYRHFGSRAGLVAAVVDDFYDRYRAEVLDGGPSDGLVERERRRTELSVAFHYADPLAPVILTGRHLDGQIAAVEQRQLDDLVSRMTAIITAAQRRGEVEKDRDPRLTASMIVGGQRQALVAALGPEAKAPEKRTAKGIWVLTAALLGVEAAG